MAFVLADTDTDIPFGLKVPVAVGTETIFKQWDTKTERNQLRLMVSYRQHLTNCITSEQQCSINLLLHPAHKVGPVHQLHL